MPKKKASGTLTREQLAHLAEESLHNAVALIGDAVVVNERGSAPHAFSIAILAGEEFGKCQLAVGTIGRISSDDEYWKDFWRTFYNHGPKLATAAQLASALVPPQSVGAFVRLLDGALRTKRREVGLYVDVVDGEIATPCDVISENEAQQAIQIFSDVINSYADVYKPEGLSSAMLGARTESERMRAALDSQDITEVTRVWDETTGNPPADWQLEMIQESWDNSDDVGTSRAGPIES